MLIQIEFKSPLGKIVVIKTLALPKINHLIKSLPNHNDQTITQITKPILYIPMAQIKINGNVSRNRTIRGGVKSTWIRRMIT